MNLEELKVVEEKLSKSEVLSKILKRGGYTLNDSGAFVAALTFFEIFNILFLQ